MNITYVLHSQTFDKALDLKIQFMSPVGFLLLSGKDLSLKHLANPYTVQSHCKKAFFFILVKKCQWKCIFQSISPSILHPKHTFANFLRIQNERLKNTKKPANIPDLVLFVF